MSDKEKYEKIKMAYNAIEQVKRDTDEDLWAYKHLSDALCELDEYYEECEI